MIRLARGWFAAFFWRKRFQQNLQRLPNRAATDHACDVEALWQRIESRLEPDVARLAPNPARRYAPYLLIAAAIPLVVLPFRFPAPSEWGLKAPQIQSMPAPSLLSFAILKSDGTIQRGHDHAKLSKGEALIFHVETPGLAAGVSVQLEILAKTPGNTDEKVIDQYRVTAPAETLQGTIGSILYEPEAPGVYRFYGFRTFAGTRDTVAGFTVEKLP